MTRRDIPTEPAEYLGCERAQLPRSARASVVFEWRISPATQIGLEIKCGYDYLPCELRLEHNCRFKVKQNANLTSTRTEVWVNQTSDSFFTPGDNLLFLLLLHHIT